MCISNSYTSYSTTDREDVDSGAIQKADCCSNSASYNHAVTHPPLKQNETETYMHYFNTDGRVECQDFMIASGKN